MQPTLRRIITAIGLCVYVILQAPHLGLATPADATPRFFFSIIEAEAMQLSGDWRVAADKEGHCPAYPQFWSGNRLRGGAGAEEARAETTVDIPADGTYAIWGRYESPYGFDTLFDVTIYQDMSLFSRGKEMFKETFGDRNDAKAFGAAWRVQGPGAITMRISFAKKVWPS